VTVNVGLAASMSSFLLAAVVVSTKWLLETSFPQKLFPKARIL